MIRPSVGQASTGGDVPWLAAGLAALLLLATLGEGGGAPTSLLLWHGALVVLTIAWLLAPGRRPIRALARPAAVAIGLLGTIFALGAARVSYGYAAFLVALELSAFLLVMILSARAGAGFLRRIVWPLRIGAALQGSWVLVQWIVQDQSRPAGSFLNPNHLAAWMVAVLLFSLGAGVSSAAGRLGLLATAIPTGMAIALAGSRGAILGATVGILFLLASWWKTLPARARIGSVMLLAIAGSLVGWQLVRRMGEADPFRYQRLRIWRASLGVLAEDPWWGSGPGQFPTVAANFSFPDGDGPLRYDRVFTATHSDLLRVPAELGIPAAIVLFLALGWMVRRCHGLRRERERPFATDGALAALLALAVQATVDNPSRWPSVYLLAATLSKRRATRTKCAPIATA